MSCRPATGLIVSCLILSGVVTPPATGQPARPEPRLDRVFPAGGRVGGAVEVQVGGADLDGADGLWFSARGLRGTPVAGRPGVFRIELAPGTPPGRHDVRVTTPVGLSNPRTFVVDERPESIEAEPNDTPTAAGPIAVNSVVNGTIRPTDVDCFAFEGRKGMRVFLDLDAERIESKLDATLHLLDPAGAEIADSRDAAGLDPFLDVTLPVDGRYVVRLHEVTYAGSDDHTYRLTLHDGPHLDAVTPGAAASGSGTVPLVLIGRGLGGQPFEGRGSDGRPLESLGMAVPAEFGPASDLAMLAVGAAIPIRGRDVRATTGRGTSNPVVLAEAPGPVVAEDEPNGADRPREVVPPCTVAATFGTPADVDVYRFRAKVGETWRIEAVAEGIGSPADPTLIVQRVDESGGVRDLATADDTADPGLGPWLNLATVDASLRWSVPADGAYQVAVADVAGTGRHGPAVGYRLTIRRESPDFRLFVVPTTPSVPAATTVRRGGRAAATVIAWRREGFAGPIWVRAATLPEGVRVDPVVIAEGRTSATIGFEADPKAPISTGAIGLVGEASSLGSPNGPLPPRPGPRSTPDLVRPAIAAAAIWPISRANPNNRTTVAPARATRGFVLAVRDGAPFRLSARPASPVAVAGTPIEIEVTVDRLGGFAGPIVVSPGDLPGAVAPATATIAEGARTARLAWTPPSGLAPGVYSFAVRGAATIRPNPKSTATFPTNEPSNPFPIAVRSP